MHHARQLLDDALSLAQERTAADRGAADRDGDDGVSLREVEAKLAEQLAATCRELGQWEQVHARRRRAQRAVLSRTLPSTPSPAAAAAAGGGGAAASAAPLRGRLRHERRADGGAAARARRRP
eukprot:497792-Prymnesium_polylepis.1